MMCPNMNYFTFVETNQKQMAIIGYSNGLAAIHREAITENHSDLSLCCMDMISVQRDKWLLLLSWAKWLSDEETVRWHLHT